MMSSSVIENAWSTYAIYTAADPDQPKSNATDLERTRMRLNQRENGKIRSSGNEIELFALGALSSEVTETNSLVQFHLS